MAEQIDSILQFLAAPAYQRGSTSDEDPRLGQFLAGSVPNEIVAAIVGFPVDEGVRLNGGRVGAAEAPNAVRPLLARMTPGGREPVMTPGFLSSIIDLGDIIPGVTLQESQSRLATVIDRLLALNVVPIVIGGGHETAFGHFLGYSNHTARPSILNVDAHPDVRPLVGGIGHSGSPFRQAIESVPGVKSYTVAGLAPHAVSAEHVSFLKKHGCRYYWNDELTSQLIGELLLELEHPTLVTLDMDVVDQAYAPGVSAPAAVGLAASELCRIAYQCGLSPKVTSIDLVEVNPRFDVDLRTSRLAAMVLWEFLNGLSQRIASTNREHDAV